jgi:hypothetical protein
MIFNPGDRYVHFTKRGGVNRGVVKEIHTTHIVDTKNGLVYLKISLINELGIIYDLDGTDGKFYPIKTELSEEDCERIKNTFNQLSERKRTWNL